MVDVKALAETVQSLVMDALRKGGIIPAETVEEEIVEADPQYIITVNGEVVPATIKDWTELEDTITAVAQSNPDAIVKVYSLMEDDEDASDDSEDHN